MHKKITTGALAAYLTVAQAAERLGLSKQTVYTMIARGQLPGAQKVGGVYYVAPEAVDALLPPRSTAPAKPAEPKENKENKP
jgi:excisionase family DNA binding protein